MKNYGVNIMCLMVQKYHKLLVSCGVQWYTVECYLAMRKETLHFTKTWLNTRVTCQAK